ncbi:MAG: YggT family protein [Myxococcota bacterium]
MLAQILLTTASFVSAIASLATFILFARILFSWLNPNPQVDFLRTIVRGVYRLTDPVLDWLRTNLSFLVVNGFDFTPIVAFFGISLIRNVAVSGLTQWAMALG